MDIRQYIGDSDFYKKVLRVALPCAFSEILISCRALISSIMVSSIGMVTAVGNASNIMYLHDYLLWGIEAGVSLYAAQFFGAKQYKNMAKSQGICLMMTLLNALFWNIIVFFFGRQILLFYLNDPSIVEYSLIYLRYVMISLFPLCLTMSFKSMYQASHNTRFTFKESAIYVVLDFIINYIFIFIFKLGIKGAGMATLLTEIICCIYMIVHTLRDKPAFYFGFREMFTFDKEFIKPVIAKILPIAFNEILFGFGQSLFNKAYGMLGTASMEVIYIGSSVLSLALSICWGYGAAVSILVGTLLGNNRIEQAIEESRYHLGLSFVIGLFLWLSIVITAPLVLKLYNIDNVYTYNQCIKLLSVYGFKAFLRVFTYVMFCTLKAGGDSKVYNLLDAGIMYAVGIPLAFLGVFMGIKDIILLVLICQLEQVVRYVLTLKRYNSYKWANNLTY